MERGERLQLTGKRMGHFDFSGRGLTGAHFINCDLSGCRFAPTREGQENHKSDNQRKKAANPHFSRIAAGLQAGSVTRQSASQRRPTRDGFAMTRCRGGRKECEKRRLFLPTSDLTILRFEVRLSWPRSREIGNVEAILPRILAESRLIESQLRQLPVMPRVKRPRGHWREKSGQQTRNQQADIRGAKAFHRQSNNTTRAKRRSFSAEARTGSNCAALSRPPKLGERT